MSNKYFILTVLSEVSQILDPLEFLKLNNFAWSLCLSAFFTLTLLKIAIIPVQLSIKCKLVSANTTLPFLFKCNF